MSIFSQRKKLEKTEKNAHSSTVHNSQTQAVPCMSPSRWTVVYSPSEVLCKQWEKTTTNIHNLDDSWNTILSQRTSLKRIFCVRLTCKFQSRRGWYEVWGRKEWQMSLERQVTPRSVLLSWGRCGQDLGCRLSHHCWEHKLMQCVSACIILFWGRRFNFALENCADLPYSLKLTQGT